jgi:hypothetical protein
MKTSRRAALLRENRRLTPSVGRNKTPRMFTDEHQSFAPGLGATNYSSRLAASRVSRAFWGRFSGFGLRCLRFLASLLVILPLLSARAADHPVRQQPIVADTDQVAKTRKLATGANPFEQAAALKTNRASLNPFEQAARKPSGASRNARRKLRGWTRNGARPRHARPSGQPSPVRTAREPASARTVKAPV